MPSEVAGLVLARGGRGAFLVHHSRYSALNQKRPGGPQGGLRAALGASQTGQQEGAWPPHELPSDVRGLAGGAVSAAEPAPDGRGGRAAGAWAAARGVMARRQYRAPVNRRFMGAPAAQG